MSTPSPEVRAAGHPFADPDADIVLRSSDNADFHVHKLILSKASPVFSDILTIPSSTSGPDASGQPPNVDELKDGIPIVRMAENQAVLDTVLRLSYPTDKPSISSDLSFVRALVRAMDKYAMVKIFPHTLESVILEAAAVQPFPAYAIACHAQMFEIANRIARVSLLHPLDFSSIQLSTEDLDLMTSSQYHQLLRYHQQSSRAAITPICSLIWLTPMEIPGVFSAHMRDCCCSHSYTTDVKDSQNGVMGVNVPNWIMQYLERCQAALVSTPHSDIILTDSVILPSILAAAQCPICRTHAGEMRGFAATVATEVELAINEVSFVLSFPTMLFTRKLYCVRSLSLFQMLRLTERGRILPEKAHNQSFNCCSASS